MKHYETARMYLKGTGHATIGKGRRCRAVYLWPESDSNTFTASAIWANGEKDIVSGATREEAAHAGAWWLSMPRALAIAVLAEPTP